MTAKEIGVALATVGVVAGVRRWVWPGDIPAWLKVSAILTGGIGSIATTGTTQAGLVGFTGYFVASQANATVTRLLTTEGLGWSRRREHNRRATEARRVN